MKKTTLAILFILVSLCVVKAQTNVNMGSQTQIQGCNFYIYDNGGNSDNYAPNLNQTLTIYPASNQGRVVIQLQMVDIDPSDTLFIYDAATATGTPLVWVNSSNYGGSTIQTYSAGANSATGALTLRFKTSNFLTLFGLNHGAGFKIHAFCQPACQPFSVTWDAAHSTILPVLNPSDNFYYLDVCPNEPLTLAVHGVYPNNQAGGYHQQDASTNFIWTLGSDTVISGVGLQTLQHAFHPSHGYDVSIVAVDTVACISNQPITFRLRTSDNPIHAVHNLPSICEGQTLIPTIGYTYSNQIQLDSVKGEQYTSLVVQDTVFLPDGISCPPYGTYYRSNVTFTDFANGATISNANDLLYVRIKMEHSAIEDLYIQIFCPNGQSATILPHPNYYSDWSFGVYRINLGIGYRPDGGTCNPNANPMGEPWNYIWSNNSTLGYSYASANGSLFNTSNFHSHYNPHWDNGTTSYSVDSTNVAAMTQVYHPYQNFSSLIGCPLNGNWYIQVQDMENEDNGYIVEWELALNPELLPQNWSYNVHLDSLYITGLGASNTTITPQAHGYVPYTLHAVDEYGCHYDTAFTVHVYEFPTVDLGADTFICDGSAIPLTPMVVNNQYNYVWSTGATSSTITVDTPGEYMVSARIMDNNTILCAQTDTILVLSMVHDETLLTDEICAGMDYDANGFQIATATIEGLDHYTATRTLVGSNGCDSIITLQLTVLPHYQEVDNVAACEQYEWEGVTYSESGDYVKHFTTINGCDSVRTLHLSIGYPETVEAWETVCGYYNWNGEIFSESGVFRRDFISSHECDSAVTMHLTVIDTFLRVSSSNPEFCTNHETTLSIDALGFDHYVWNNGETATAFDVTLSGLYSVTASNVACQQTAFVQVPYCPLNVLLPNTITPSNGDGLNDMVSLPEYYTNQINTFDITIYSRWGEAIFYSSDKNFVWDGMCNGKLMVNNIFKYVIHCTDYTGRPYMFTGSIVVL